MKISKLVFTSQCNKKASTLFSRPADVEVMSERKQTV